MKSLQNTHRLRRAGFTLIELVVVVGVLVVLAGFILPKLDTFKLKANKGVAAATMGSATQAIEVYRIQRDRYPDFWDSLLDATTTSSLAPQLHPQLFGGPGTSAVKLTVVPISSQDELNSMGRLGITSVIDHNLVSEYPNDGANTPPRALQVGDTIATVNAADGDGQAIIESFYPGSGGVVPAGKTIWVLGLGSLNEMIGDTLYNAPFYPNADQLAYYSRYLACFEVDLGGSRARLLGCVGSDGDRLAEEIKDYYEN